MAQLHVTWQPIHDDDELMSKTIYEKLRVHLHYELLEEIIHDLIKLKYPISGITLIKYAYP